MTQPAPLAVARLGNRRRSQFAVEQRRDRRLEPGRHAQLRQQRRPLCPGWFARRQNSRQRLRLRFERGQYAVGVARPFDRVGFRAAGTRSESRPFPPRRCGPAPHRRRPAPQPRSQRRWLRETHLRQAAIRAAFRFRRAARGAVPGAPAIRAAGDRARRGAPRRWRRPRSPAAAGFRPRRDNERPPRPAPPHPGLRLRPGPGALQVGAFLGEFRQRDLSVGKARGLAVAIAGDLRQTPLGLDPRRRHPGEFPIERLACMCDPLQFGRRRQLGADAEAAMPPRPRRAPARGRSASSPAAARSRSASRSSAARSAASSAACRHRDCSSRASVSRICSPSRRYRVACRACFFSVSLCAVRVAVKSSSRARLSSAARSRSSASWRRA